MAVLKEPSATMAELRGISMHEQWQREAHNVRKELHFCTQSYLLDAPREAVQEPPEAITTSQGTNASNQGSSMSPAVANQGGRTHTNLAAEFT